MDVWAQPGVFEKLFPSVFRNSPRFWAQPGFSEELFPLACRRLGTDAIFVKTDPNLAGNQGEQLNENSRLCPILAGCLRIHGIRNSIFLSCAQMPEIHGEHFRKICSCAQILSIVCECTADRILLCLLAFHLPADARRTGYFCTLSPFGLGLPGRSGGLNRILKAVSAARIPHSLDGLL